MKPTKFSLALTIVCALALYAGSRASAGSQPMESQSIAELHEPEPFSWTGFYIGGNLGGAWSDYEFGNYFVDVDVDQQADEFFGSMPTSATNGAGPVTNGRDFFGFAEFEFPGTGPEGSLFHVGSDDGFTGGGQVGFNKQWGHFVVGLEGDFNRTSTSASQTFAGTETNFFSFINTSQGPSGGLFAVTDVTSLRRAETDWTASARGRLGWANGHVLLYVTGGAAWAHINVFANDTARTEFFEFTEIGDIGIPFTNTDGGPIVSFPIGATSNSNFAKVDKTILGWTGGGGGEWAVTDMVSIGVEYRHSDFGSHTYVFADNGGPIFPGPMTVDLENDQVTVRFNILLSHFFGR